MKKIILTCVLLIGITSLSLIKAQTSTSFGVKLNGNVTHLKLENRKSSFEPGASIGAFSKIEFGNHFALQPELMLNYSESKVKYGNQKIKYKYASVEIPIYAMGQFKAGNGKLFFGIGPDIGYGFGIDSKKEKLNDNEPGANKLDIHHWFLGGAVIAGYEFKNGLTLHSSYQQVYDLSSGNKRPNMDVHTISLGIGYKF